MKTPLWRGEVPKFQSTRLLATPIATSNLLRYRHPHPLTAILSVPIACARDKIISVTYTAIPRRVHCPTSFAVHLSWQEGTTTIDLVQTIVDTPAPKLDAGQFSPEFCRFLECCLHQTPCDRLPAEALLGSPWMTMNGALDLASTTANVKSWIDKMG